MLLQLCVQHDAKTHLSLGHEKSHHSIPSALTGEMNSVVYFVEVKWHVTSDGSEKPENQSVQDIKQKKGP